MRLKRSRTQAGQEAPSPPEHRHRRTASPIERLHVGLVLPGGTMFRTTKQSEVSPGAAGGGTPTKVTAVDVMRARLRVQSQSAAAVLGAFVMAPAVGASAYAELCRKHLVSVEWRTTPLPAFDCALDHLAEEAPKIPKLLRAYLSIGAKICGPPALDRQFRTIDFLTLLDLHKMPALVRARFLD